MSSQTSPIVRFWSLLLMAGAGIGLSSCETAYADDIDVHLLGVGTSSRLSESSVTSNADGVGIGYSLLLSGRLTPRVNLRTGGMLLTRKTQSTAMPSRGAIVLPLLFGYRFAPSFKLELGGYYEIGSGAVPAGVKSAAYGLMGGMQIDMPLIAGVGLLLGGHYVYQISNLSDVVAQTLAYRDYVVTAGFRLGLTR